MNRNKLEKIPTEYTLEVEAEAVKVLRNGKIEARTVAGVASALEAIFVLDNMTKNQWLICEDGVVYEVDREQWKIAEDREEEITTLDQHQ